MYVAGCDGYIFFASVLYVVGDETTYIGYCGLGLHLFLLRQTDLFLFLHILCDFFIPICISCDDTIYIDIAHSEYGV